jgi:DNA-binding NarL/FixJ family response regulator
MPTHPFRVLLADDDFVVSMDLTARLQDLDCRVIGPAHDIEAAIDLVRKSRLDGAIVEASLRGASAGPLLEELLARNLPILVLSASPEEIAARFPALPILSKPFAVDAFVDAALSLRIAPPPRAQLEPARMKARGQPRAPNSGAAPSRSVASSGMAERA